MTQHNLGRVLFVGTGGGNDIFSTILAADTLWLNGGRWHTAAVAGVLSPFHEHVGKDQLVEGAYLIRPDTRRFVCRNDYSKRIGFVDAEVAKMIRDVPMLNIKNVIGLSLQKGSIGLAETLQKLNEYFDQIILVDVGGDIFYRGKEDPHVLSPMFDAIVLKAFVDSGVPGFLLELGPGTDGELEPEALEEALKDVDYDTLQRASVDSWESLYRQWIEPVRTGRTVPTLIQAFRSRESMIELTYKARAHIGEMKFYHSFEQRIKTLPCHFSFLVDPRKIKNPFAVECDSPLDWFLSTQVAQHRTNCEANLEYWKFGGKLHQFLTPSPLFSEADRKKLIEQGLKEFDQGACDIVLMFADDWWDASARHDAKMYALGNFGDDLIMIESRSS